MRKLFSTLLLVALGFMVISTVYAQGTLSNQYVNEAFNSKAANIRLNLNTLLREHTVLGATLLKSLYLGQNTTQLQSLMDANQNELGNLVQTAYGTNAKNSFMALWSAHMKEYRNYTLAKKSNNTVGMNTARKNLQTISTSLGDLFAVNNMAASTIASLMQDHVNGTLAYVDAVAAKNTTAEANGLKQGYDRAGKFADALTMGLILDRPNLFK
ncbi:MAG: hypothetical protein ACM3IJ_05595 [Candidatus Levyibacteriota bacterium]